MCHCNGWASVGLALLVWLWQSVPAMGQPAPVDAGEARADRLDHWLADLELDGLRLEWRLRQLAREPRRAERLELSRNALDLYVRVIASGRWTGESLQQLVPAVMDLLRDYPELETDAIRLSVLHGEFSAREYELFTWWPDPHPHERWVALRLEMARLANALDDVGARLAQSLRDRALTQGRDDPVLAAQLAQQMFVHGWACYYVGVLDEPARQEWWRRAGQSFRRFLDIGDESALSGLPIDWLTLETPWQRRAILGLCLLAQGASRDSDAAWCLAVLERQTRHTTRRDEQSTWELRGLAWAGRWQDAVHHAQSRLDRAGDVTTGDDTYWLACLDVAIRMRLEERPMADALLEIAVSGWAAQWRLDVVAERVVVFPVKWRDEVFVDRWLQGIIALHRANATRDRQEALQRHREAEAHLKAALSLLDPDRQPLQAASANLLLGHSAKAAEDWPTAVSCAERARDNAAPWPVVRRLAAALAAEGHVQLAAEDPLQWPAAWQAADALEREFPDSWEAQRAAWELVKLENRRLPPSEALEMMNRLAVTPGLTGDVAVERLRLMHRSWQTEYQRNVEAAEPLLRILIEHWSDLEAMEGAFAPTHGVAARLLVADAWLRHTAVDSPRWIEVTSMIEQARQLSAQLAPTSPLIFELRYLQMVVAERLGDDARQEAEANWLADFAKGTAWERAALVTLAQIHDARLSASDAPSVELVEAARRVFQRVVEAFAPAAPAAEGDSTWRLALRRLAACDAHLKQWESANARYDQLLQLATPDRELLLAAGRVKMELRAWGSAAQVWRRLIAGSTPGTESWLEARWYLLRCLLWTDPAAAEAMREQTLLLYPHMPEIWRARFIEAQREGDPDAQ